ncbi:MAG: EF-hand domain-containing protein [Alphaproteobacteria bacterium]
MKKYDSSEDSPRKADLCISNAPWRAAETRASRRLASYWPALLVCACAVSSPPPKAPAEFHPPRAILEAYDANHDGVVTRGELEQGLRVEFTKADARHTACLDAEEARAVNEQRWAQDQSTASPLVDFKGNGCIDFDEFAATARSLFEQMDGNGDGKITSDEFQPHKRSAPTP